MKGTSLMSRCHECRYTVLETLASFAGLSIRPRCASAGLIPAAFSRGRRFHQSRKWQSEILSTSRKAPDAPHPPQPSQPSHLWYLQVPLPTTPSNTSYSTPVEEPDIPSLPANAPPILSPLLQHTYHILGLDALTLLDLRHITTPPPALGPNLIMVLATARSVKHLNVSADRLCRWARTTYKLRPFADGLLGRNELKLKLRRKARRQRLAASVGNTVDANSRGLGGDDGITTGWICVNLGVVGEAELNKETTPAPEGRRNMQEVEEDEEEYINPDPNDSYIGFGNQTSAPRIVVQMFTEEKRAEMDLEGLWGIRQTRRERKEEKIDRNTVENRYEEGSVDLPPRGDSAPSS